MSVRTWSVGFGVVAALLIVLVGGEGLAPTRLHAQAAKGKMKFEIYQDAAKEYRWRLKAANGEILATAGEGYKAKDDCKKGVDRVKADANSDKLTFELYGDSAKEHRWRLKAPNGQIIGVASEGYKVKADCEKVVDLIKAGAAKAEVEDKT